jgi:hypothetical protein
MSIKESSEKMTQEETFSENTEKTSIESLAKEEKRIQKLIETYSKGFQLVSYGTTQYVQLPSGKQLEFIKYPSGDVYVIWYGKRRKFTQALIEEIDRAQKNLVSSE